MKSCKYSLFLLISGLTLFSKPLEAFDPFDMFDRPRAFWSSYFSEPANNGFITQNTSGLSLYEEDNFLVVEANMPGMNPEEIEITYDSGNLRIEAQKREEENSKRDYYHKCSNYYAYNVKIPEKVDEGINPVAEYNNGLMTIKFQKLEKAPPKKIEIKKK